MAISMLKIRRPLGRLIFNMGITIPSKTVFLIETAPWWFVETEMENGVHDSFLVEQKQQQHSGFMNENSQLCDYYLCMAAKQGWVLIQYKDQLSVYRDSH